MQCPLRFRFGTACLHRLHNPPEIHSAAASYLHFLQRRTAEPKRAVKGGTRCEIELPLQASA
jgi:hypothetical protein